MGKWIIIEVIDDGYIVNVLKSFNTYEECIRYFNKEIYNENMIKCNDYLYLDSYIRYIHFILNK